MSIMHCPHCGAENFTMEGWEDLDHCSSCGKALGQPITDPLERTNEAANTGSAGRAGHRGSEGQSARKPRRV